MTSVRSSPAVGRFAALVLLAGLLLGCQDDPDPRAQLEAAVATTATQPFTFTLTAQGDRAALEQLGGDAVATAGFLAEAGLSGAREPDGRLLVALSIGGGAPLLEAISDGEGALLLRTGLGEVLGLEGRDPSDVLDPALDQLGVDAAGREALATSFAGGWVALTDVDDLGELLGATGGAGTGADTGADPDGEGGLRAVFEDVTVGAARDVGEVRRLTVQVPANALLAPFGLGATERAVPGTVDLRGGRIHEVRLELSTGDLTGRPPTDDAATDDAPDDDGTDADTTGDEAADAGVLELVLRIVPADGDDPVVPRPEPGATLTAAQLFDLVGRLQAASG